MRKLMSSSLILLLLVCLLSSVQAAQRAKCYVMWDDYYFYAAFEVQDTNVTTTNTKYMSRPWEDDDVEVFLETDQAKAQDRSSHTFQMCTSAGGGSSYLIGQDGKAVPKNIYTFKYASKIQGTPNNPADRDIGYTVELAIPWQEMGGVPKPGDVMSFNAVCRLQGENIGFVSFSPDVKAEEDVQVPAKWGTIKFVNTATVVSMVDNVLICRKVMSKAPTVDGNLGPGEWNRDMGFFMTLPEPTITAVKPVEKFLVERLSLSPYYFYLQVPKKADGSIDLVHRPAEGVGPWYTSNRVQWHKDQLIGMNYAGIEVALPVLSSGSSSELAYMVQALKDLKVEGKSYPLIGMYMDVPSSYAKLADFFLQVPEEFRATVELPAEKGWQPAYVVALGSSDNSSVEASWIDDCNKRFAADFGGRRLIWIGDSGYKAKLVSLDGYVDGSTGDGGWIRVASISPGQKRTDAGYQQAWDALLGKSPDWVMVNSWNDLQTGNEICPTVEFADRYSFLTKINLLRFNGMRGYDAKFLKHNTPSAMTSGSICQVTLTIKNAGTKAWYPGDGIFLAGRWFKDGALFADSGARLPLQEKVLAGQVLTKMIGVRTVDQGEKPLPEGDYELRWELMRGRDEWFSNNGDTPLCVPMKVGTPSPGFSLVSTSAPTLMKTGAAYTINAKLRNDGPATMKKGTAKVGYTWLLAAKASSGDGSAFSFSPLTAENAVDLAADADPGRLIEVSLPVKQGEAPLPISAERQDGASYVLKWGLFDGERWLEMKAESGVGVSSEVVSVVREDGGCRLQGSDTPSRMVPGKKIPVNLKLENAGISNLAKTACTVGYRWYNGDGVEVASELVAGKLTTDLKAGESQSVKASVTAPAANGRYYLVWGIVSGGKWVTGTNTRGNDLLVVPVTLAKK